MELRNLTRLDVKFEWNKVHEKEFKNLLTIVASEPIMSIVFACQRFHYFVNGREFTIKSYHKPLETLINKDIDDVTMRLQRMFMFLLKYPGMTITYRPGKEMLVANCLSRAQLSEEEELEGLSRAPTAKIT